MGGTRGSGILSSAVDMRGMRRVGEVCEMCMCFARSGVWEEGAEWMIQNQNPFLTAQSTQIKSVISVPIKDCIHHYARALFNDIPGSGRTFTTYPGQGALLRHTRGAV